MSVLILSNPAPYIDAIEQILSEESYVPSKYNTRQIYESGKYRTLNYTRTFPDRIIQHCLLQVVGPILKSTFIETTYAAIPDKGLHKAAKSVKQTLKQDPIGTKYCLKLDVHHYFENVDRDILYSLICKKIKCKQTLNLIHIIIYTAPSTGIPIGNYASQYFSNFYLSYFDHYCKENLGIKYYYRYMDDIVILYSNKLQLHRYLNFINIYITNNLKLKLKKNYQIFPVESRGIDFLGFVFRHDYTRLRKRIKHSLIKSINFIIYNIHHHVPITSHSMQSLQSYIGFSIHCDSKHLIHKYINRLDCTIAGFT